MPKIQTLLLDGFMGNHRRLRRMQYNLEQGGITAGIWPYDSSGKTDLETLGQAFALFLKKQPAPLYLVGYSMGGLVIRTALLHDPSLAVEKTVFLCTPHHGTFMGHFLALPSVRQMRIGSGFLRMLNKSPWTIPTLNVWCPGDLMVVPGWNARFSQATNEWLKMPAHVWPLFSSSLHRRIAAYLSSE